MLQELALSIVGLSYAQTKIRLNFLCLMNLHLLRNAHGFTLIEALVAIVVAGIFAAIAAPSFTAWLSHKKIDDVAAQIEGAIREAQAEAIKESKPCTLSISKTDAQVTSDRLSCLPTGPRDLKKLGVKILSNNSSGISLGIANLGDPAQIQFSYKGTLSIAHTGIGLITIYQDGGTGGQKIRCIAIASGIGLIRTGRYLGSSPEAPTDTTNCATNIMT
jgi:prepilin-type N-terminal cleavage/methylation domain-containing protein